VTQQPELLGRTIVSELARELLDRPVISNLMRAALVERLVLHALGPSWRYVGADWSGRDLEDARGARVEVKQSAARQT
jgi:hypothetical protein